MEINKNSNLDRSYSKLFGFQLNPSQKNIVAILSFIGIFLLPFFLAVEVILNLGQALFMSLPSYLSHPEVYVELYLFYAFVPPLSRIIADVIFLYLSVHSVKRLFLAKNDETNFEIDSINDNKTVSWLGHKLSSDQALIIYILAIIGLVFIPIALIGSFTFLSGIFNFLLFIPTGVDRAYGHTLIDFYAPIIIYVIFYMLSIYTALKIRHGGLRKKNGKRTKTHAIFLFIISLITLLLCLLRFATHLFLFTDLAYLLGTTPEPKNSFQTQDFFLVIIILIVSIAIMNSSFFMRGFPKKENTKELNIKWFGLKLTNKGALKILAIGIVFLLYSGFSILIGLFSIPFLNWFTIIVFYGIPIVVAIIAAYTVNAISKNHRLDRLLTSMQEKEGMFTNWFKLNLSYSLSMELYGVFLGVLILFFYNLFTFLVSFSFSFAFGFEISYITIGTFIISIILVILILITIFTMTKIKNAYKNR